MVDELGACLGVFDGCAGEAELVDEAVLADFGGLALFFEAGRLHLLVGVVGVFARAGAAASVGAGDAAEPGVFLLIAGADAVVGHEFEVVLVGSDA